MSLRDFLFYEEPGIQLYCGDARMILPMLCMDTSYCLEECSGACCAAIVTDPPGGPADNFSDAEFAWTSVRTHRNMLRVQWKGIAGVKAGEFLPRAHPSQKPVRLMTASIQIVGGSGLVIDPYSGSGTTLQAAKSLSRPAIGIEIEPSYCELAVKRLRQEVLPFRDTERVDL